MNGYAITGTFLLMLAACSVPPQAQDEIVMLPTVTVEEVPLKLDKEIKVPALKPIPHPAKAPVKSTADTRCPPIEGETEQQRIIRKLDCLLERD